MCKAIRRMHSLSPRVFVCIRSTIYRLLLCYSFFTAWTTTTNCRFFGGVSSHFFSDISRLPENLAEPGSQRRYCIQCVVQWTLARTWFFLSRVSSSLPSARRNAYIHSIIIKSTYPAAGWSSTLRVCGGCHKICPHEENRTHDFLLTIYTWLLLLRWSSGFPRTGAKYRAIWNHTILLIILKWNSQATGKSPRIPQGKEGCSTVVLVSMPAFVFKTWQKTKQYIEPIWKK